MRRLTVTAWAVTLLIFTAYAGVMADCPLSWVNVGGAGPNDGRIYMVAS